jgi:hypothetical protein
MLLASARFAIAARRTCRLTLGTPGLRRILERTGWLLDRCDDGPDRFLAVAIRTLDGDDPRAPHPGLTMLG